MITLKKIARWALYGLLLLLIVITITALALRFAIFPHIDQYKDDIAHYVSKSMGQKITIGNIVTGWDGVSPKVNLQNTDVYDAENRVALHLNTVEGSLSWWSIPRLQPRLSKLIVHQPALTIRRKADGSIYLAGIALAGESKPDFTNWLLHQRMVKVENAQLIWQDDLRQAPALSLNQFNLTLQNPVLNRLLGQHQFTLSALPSVGTQQKITANGQFVGRDVAKINEWHGDFFADLKQTDLTAFKPWLDYPIDMQSGTGNAKIWLTFANSQIDSIKTQANISNLAVITKFQQLPLIAQTFAGDVQWQNKNNTQTFNATNITLITNSGLDIRNGNGYYAHSIKNNQPYIKADIQLNQFNLASLKPMTAHFNLPKNVLAQLNGFAPAGNLQALNLHWEGTNNNAKAYKINTRFNQLGIQAFQKIPGFDGLTGSIDADETGGTVTLNSQNANLHFKDILRWPVPASRLTGDIKWAIKNDALKITAQSLFISSPHLTGTLNAKYDMNGVKGGYLDLSGQFGKGNAKFAPFYYPTILGEDTIHWLDTSILEGQAENIMLTVKGHLADFPYVDKQHQPDSKLGIFKVTAKISDAVLEYGTGWPIIDNLDLDMLFEGKRMLLLASDGRISGKKIIKSRAEIAQLDADWPILHIASEAEGLVADGIKFVNESPVKQVTMGFTDDLKTAGRGKLLLDLKIPLQNSELTKYKGIYKVSNGTIFANADIGLPELSKINGSLTFSETGLAANNVSAEVFGGPTQFNLATASDKTIQIKANGKIRDVGIQKMTSNALTQHIAGSANWSGEISIKKPLVNISLRSNLIGLAVQLPPPFNKQAQQELNLNIEKKQLNADSDAISVIYGNVLSAKMLRTNQAGELAFERGSVGINTPAAEALQAGLSVNGKFEEIDVNDWLALLAQPANSSNNHPSSNSATLNLISKADISIRKLNFGDRSINSLKVIAQPNATGLKMAVDAKEMLGDVEWQSADNGKIIARLKRLSIPNAANSTVKTKTKTEFRKQMQAYPALDVVADNFEIGGKKLGALNLNAFENGEDWVVQQLTINNPDSTLALQGNWHNWTRNPNTNLVLTLNSNNVGKTLVRFGQPDTVKGGEAQIEGRLSWAGSPHEFDIARLDGNLTFEATSGQVLKVQPGVGRLFGLLTLQSLPRRLSLDFRDLFSDGFAFDKISATAKIDSGIVRSDDFFMTGPAAEAKIKGETNLKTETQHLRIKVTPHVSDSLSLAALVGGPIVGAAAFVAQKILKDPFNKIAATDYVISGTWDNPIEIKSENDDAKKPINQSPLQ
ncbi:MAG: YhdP family protein [Pseudomonadota bacterium]